MKTLYESILDNDAMERMEDDVLTYALRGKIIKSILNTITKVIINLKLDYRGESKVHGPLYRLDSDDLYSYDFIRRFMPKESGIVSLADIESDLTKAFKKYKYELVRLESEHDRQEILFVFKKVGLSILVSLSDVRVPAGTKFLNISLAGDRNDGLVINSLRSIPVKIQLKTRSAK
jgi:hypothetical protein